MNHARVTLDGLLHAVTANPHDGLALARLGAAYGMRGLFDQAIETLGRALEIEPQIPEIRYNLGNALRAKAQSVTSTQTAAQSTAAQQSLFEQAAAAYEAAIGVRAAYPEAHFNLANTLADLGLVDAAADHYRTAISLRADYAKAYLRLGKLRLRTQAFASAIDAFNHVVRLRPNWSDGHFYLGNAWHGLQEWERAADSFRRAVVLQADHVSAHNNLGMAFRALGRLEEAEASFRRAIQYKSGLAAAHTNLGGVLAQLGREDDAIGCLDDGLAIDPQFAEAHCNLAQIHLRRGDFAHGWSKYQWRLKSAVWAGRQFARPAWDGHNPVGKRILLWSEQGLGDTIQFVRFATLLNQRGADVTVQCEPPLAPLLSRCLCADESGVLTLVPDVTVVARGDELPEFDTHAALMSLPYLLKITVETVPADVPYLVPDRALIDKWEKKLAHAGGFRVGVAWQGQKAHFSDRLRSVHLNRFGDIAALPGVQLVSLQKGFGAEQVAEFQNQFEIIDLRDDLDNQDGAFMDTAAVMSNLDLVIATDSAVAHLAGALGVPVWVALHAVPDWRWMMDRDDSPWYPTMKLFRQQQRGDWDDVFERMAAELSQVLAH